MLKMTDLKKKIFNNYKFSLKNYKQNHQSNHWSYNNNKKKKIVCNTKTKKLSSKFTVRRYG